MAHPQTLLILQNQLNIHHLTGRLPMDQSVSAASSVLVETTGSDPSYWRFLEVTSSLVTEHLFAVLYPYYLYLARCISLVPLTKVSCV